MNKSKSAFSLNYLMLLAAATVGLAMFLLLRHINELTEANLLYMRQINELKESCHDTSLLKESQKNNYREIAFDKNFYNKKATGDLTPEEGREWQSWMRSRGLITAEELDEYRHYDRKTLESFAKSGDLKAIDLLFDMEFLNEDENHLSSYYANQGVIWGSTADISRLLLMKLPDDLLSKEENKENFYESLAISKTLQIRGDEITSEREVNSSIDRYESYLKGKVSLTPEDHEQINQRAQEIYNEWQAERNKLGIGDFDNSRPAGVDRLFSNIKALSKK